MAVKVADTLRPNNSGDEPIKGGFPTALACDVWLSDGRSVEEAIESTIGASIQVTELPDPSETQFGKIYQYTGETTDDYINGYFYECIIDGAAYKWTEKTVQKSNADISEEENNIIEQKADGLYVPKTTAIIYVDALPEYGAIDDYIYRIQNNQYKELDIDGSIMNGNDPQAAVDHITSKGFVVNDPDEPDHEGYYEAVFKFRDIEYHDELTDQYPMIAKFYIRKSASIVGDKFIAKTTTDGETYTELAFSSEDMITLRYKEETMYLGDKESQSLARMALYSDLDTLDIDAVIYDNDLPIPADRKNKVYCIAFTNDSLVFDTTNDHYLYDIVDYAHRNNFTVEYSTEYYVIIHTSAKEVYQTSDRDTRIGKIEVYINNNVTLTVYDTTNNVIKSEEASTITLDLITESLTPYLCQTDSSTSFKLLSYDEYKSSILARVARVPENATSGFYQEDLYTNVVIEWTSIESVIASLESSGFTVTPKESDPSEYWIDFPNNYRLLRISGTSSLEEHLTTKDLCERMDLKMSGVNPMISVYCNGALKTSFSGNNFRYAVEQDSTDKNDTKITVVNSNGDKTRLALYDDYLRSITQVHKLPEANEDNQGKIYQYIGVTDIDYRKGSFYECISDEEAIPTYSWRELGSGGSITIKDVDELPTSNIENIIYRLPTSTFSTTFNQSDEQMILVTKGFTYTEDTVDGVLIGEWTTNLEVYVEIGSEYKRVNKIIYKYSSELGCYHKIMYNDEVLHEATEHDSFTNFYFKTAPAYYAGDTINQQTEQLAKYDDIPDVSKKPNIFTGTQDEWEALTTEEKENYEIVNITDDEGSGEDSFYPSAPTTPEMVFNKANQSSDIDSTYIVTEKAFHIIKVHVYSEGVSHLAAVYLNGIAIGSASSYQATSGVGYTVTIPCNVGDTIRMVVNCGGYGAYDKRSAVIFRLNR